MCELSLLIASNEGALIRVLGTIERRGFTLGALSSKTTAQGLQLTISVSAEGRSVEVLLRQLQRLVDVREAAFELPRPVFRLPARAAANAPVIPASNRRGLSFLGLPDRISDAEAVYA
jgi:acetolactate synthase II small subunit